jgi:hypothetical protein
MWSGHILLRNCLRKDIIEGKTRRKTDIRTRRQRIRRKQLLDEFKETRGYRKFKEETLDRTLLRTRFGRGCGPVARYYRMNDLLCRRTQTRKGINKNTLHE